MKDKKEFNLPAFLFYPNDFIGSTAHLEVETVGAYIRLLCFQWVNGFIPRKPKQIQGIISCGNDKFKEVWDELKEKFSPTTAGFANKRLEMVRGEAMEYRKNASERGKAGAEARWHKQCSSNAQAMPKNSLSSSSSSSISSSKEDIPAKAGTPQAEFVEAWSDLYQSETGGPYKAGREDFVIVARLLKTFGEAEVLSRAKILLAACRSRLAWFTKDGLADFTIKKLSSQWNALIPALIQSKNTAGADEWLRKEQEKDGQAKVS